jgi:predicted membrane-bound spermidine synthase
METSSAPRHRSADRVLLPVLLMLSGAAGLSYEVVWLRLLANVIGCSTAATATILAVFMAGMAAGSMVLGPVADRVRRPLVLYAVLELILAATAVLLPRLVGLVETIDLQLGQLMGGTSGLISRSLAAALVLLVPTFVMGGTLPAIAAHLARIGSGGGAFFTFVYGVHVMGAAAGCLAASFLLIPALGLSQTSALGSVLNVTAAVGCLWLARRDTGVAAPARAATPSVPQARSVPVLALYATAFLSGLVLLGCEVVFVRTLVMALSAKVHSFALMLSVFLVGLSIASFIAGRLPRRLIESPTTLACVLLLGAMGLLLSREVLVWRPLPVLLAAYGGGVSTQEYLRIALELCAQSLLVVTLPLGMVLPIILRKAGFAGSEAGHAVGRILFWNTVGSIAGPLLAPYVGIASFGLLGSLWVAAIAVAAAGLLWALPALAGRRGRVALASAAVVAVAAGVALVLSPPRFSGTVALDCTLFGEYQTQRKGEQPTILEYREAPTCTVTVYQGELARRFIRIDGFEAAGAPGPQDQHYLYMRLMAHLPVMLHSTGKVRDVLVICCGTGTTAGSLALHRPERLELVDLHPEVLASLHWFDAANHDLARNASCVKIADDGRAYLRRHRAEYDVITLEPMPPQFAGMTQLYSVEFYQSCARALREDGVVCQWLPYHLVTRDQALAITRAMADVFTSVQVWEYKTTGILIGSMRPDLPIDRAHVSSMLENADVRRDFELAGIQQPVELSNCYVCSAADLKEELATVEPVHDDRPSLEYAVVGYGLVRHEKEELARIREPFFRARTRSTLPLSGFIANEDAVLKREWLARSVLMFSSYLAKTQSAEAARAFVAQATDRHPELKQSPSFQQGARSGD